LLSGFRIPFYKPIFIKSRTKVAFRKQKFGKGGK
jgi:hypothetical protein